MEKREDMNSDDQRDAMNNPDGDVSEVQLGKISYENNIEEEEEEADDDENDSLALSLTSCSYSNSTTKKPSIDSFSSSTHLSPQEITRPHYHEITISPLNPLPTEMLIPPPSQRLMTQIHDLGILIPPPPPPPPPQMMMNTSFPFNLQVHVSQPTFGCDGNDSSSNITVNHHQHQPAGPLQRAPRARGRPARIPREGRSETVPVIYPWATDRRARVHSLEYLRSKQIETISGLVQCKKCERRYELGFNLEEKFAEIGNFIARYKSLMHDRAPAFWLNPVFPKCKYCNFENGVRPVMAENKKEINWLFLLLGQMLGFLTLEQLKYFCKHTKNHRTGAKDRVLYLTYLGLCKQLDPNGPFDR